MPDSVTRGTIRSARLWPIRSGASRLRCERHVLTSTSAIRDLRHLTRAFLKVIGVPDDTAGAVELVVGEALANVHLHAYRGDTGPIDFTLDVEGAQLTCVIRDRGCATTDLKIPAGSPARRGGLGLFIMGELMDDVEISHPDGRERGTLVRMRKTLSPAETRA